MAEDWAVDVKKYAPNADDGVIAAIVRHLGIALRSRDASLVSFTDPAELETVRESWLKKKLGLTDPDTVLDAAIARVGERMKADHTKNRVTVYYLLAEAFGKLGLFGAATVAAVAPVAVPAAAAVAAVAAAPLAAAAIPAPVDDDDDDDNGWIKTALLTLAGMAVIVIGAAIFGGILGRPAETGPVPIAPQTMPIASTTTTTTETVAPAIPTGAGVTATEVDGKPKVSVYFDTAKSDVSPDFATVAAPIKAYVDSHPGTMIGVSGFNDPRGNAAMNAELSKNRAKSVRSALVVIGVPIEVIDLIKPAETSDTTDALAEGRRVDIYVADAVAPAAATDAAPAAAPDAPPAGN
jgi:outer membrane protein OmpA-like peptidoglycan-associated protein